jgi:hypothetical protein
LESTSLQANSTAALVTSVHGVHAAAAEYIEKNRKKTCPLQEENRLFPLQLFAKFLILFVLICGKTRVLIKLV